MPVAQPTLLPTNENPGLRWLGLTGAATALQVARAATQAAGPVLLVTSDAATAARLEEELAFFCAGAVPIFGFPGYETLPYDQFSPHPDIISQRLRTMARLPAARAWPRWSASSERRASGLPQSGSPRSPAGSTWTRSSTSNTTTSSMRSRSAAEPNR